VLPAAARLRRREDFADAVRRGRRSSRGPRTLHLAVAPVSAAAPAPAATQAGFVVGKAVGPAVVRNRLRRRLRHLLRTRLAALPPGSRLVVRARPGAGDLDSAALGRLLDAALPRLTSALTDAG
jgi:ribonuclease P protein component